MTFPAIYGCVAASRMLAGAPPVKTTWKHWGVELRSGVEGSPETLRMRSIQWNFVSGVHTQNLASASNIHSDIGPSNNSLTDLYTNSTTYVQWLSSSLPSNARVKIWGTFASEVTVAAMGLMPQSFTLYMPETFRFIWSDDAVTWFGGTETARGSWSTTDYNWFDTGF